MTRLRIDSIATYAIAALAFALSYSKLVDLASRADYGPVMSHVWPLIVDGLAVMAARGVLRLATGRWYAWALLVAGTATSIAAAVTNAMMPAGPLPPAATAAVTIIPALCLPFALHLARKMQDAADIAHDIAPVDVAVDQAVAAEQDIAPVHDDETPPPVAADTDCDEPLYLELVASQGVTPRRRAGKYSEAQKAEALQLVAAGVPQREVGRRFGTSGNTVKGWVRAAERAA